MANVLGELFSKIAYEIKKKTGDPDTVKYKPAEFPAKIKSISVGEGSGDIEYVDGVDPYYQKLAEAVITRNAEYLSGDERNMSMKGFVLSDGNILGTLDSYSFAGFKYVESMSFTSVVIINKNAFADDVNLRILDITIPNVDGLNGAQFTPGSLNGCTSLEAVIIRDGGVGISSVGVSIDNGANDTFYVYVPSKYYNTIIGNLTSARIPADRYRKLEDYPAVDNWNKTFTVNFYDGETLVDTKVVKYGETATTSYKKPGYTLTKWTPDPVNVTEDMDCYGTWSISFADTDWSTIASLSESGEASSVFKIGDTKTFTCNGYTLTAQIAAMGVDTLADGSGKAGITCVITKAYPVQKAHSTSVSNTTISPWSTSTLRSYCNDTIYNGLEESLKAVVKQVNKISQKKYDSETTQDYCWALGIYEVGDASGYESSGPRYSDMFPDAESRKRTPSTSTSYVTWNLRSVGAASMNYTVSTSGSVANSSGQSTARYFLFGFCI